MFSLSNNLALCERPRTDRIAGDSTQCFQPGSVSLDEVLYNGDTSITEHGKNCVNWLKVTG